MKFSIHVSIIHEILAFFKGDGEIYSWGRGGSVFAWVDASFLLTFERICDILNTELLFVQGRESKRIG
jgi:hypothetical protein